MRASELRAAIKDKLPDYMIPAIVVLESLPLTENGKINLVGLPAAGRGTERRW